jgi:hypothetical protein
MSMQEVQMAITESAENKGAGLSAAKDAVDAALASDQLPSCALDEAGVREQQARHDRLAPSVVNVERRGEALLFGFAESYDRQALAEMVAVERRCCPFFDFAFDQHRRELRVGVREKEMLPALEAIATHLGSRWEEQRGKGSAPKAG